MLEVEEKITTFWHNTHPDKFDPNIIFANDAIYAIPTLLDIIGKNFF